MIGQLSDRLTKDDRGIYHASTRSKISYPEDQNANCMQFEDASSWFRHRNDCIAAMVRNYPPGGPILDIGGGNGYVAKGLEESGFKTIVMEPGETGALNAKNVRGIEHVICATIQDAEIKSASVSAAGMFDVIEHIEEDIEVLKEVHRILKPGGRFYLSVPAHQWLWSQVDEDAGHYRRYTKKSMSKALQAAGFEVEYSSYIFTLLPLPIFLLRSIPSLMGIKKKHKEIVETKKKEHTQKTGLLSKVWQ